MRLVASFAAWRPHDKQGDPVDHANTLEATFPVGISCVFSRQEVTVEERLQVGKIDPVQLEIDVPLGFIPCDHVLERICGCISVQEGLAQPIVDASRLDARHPRQGRGAVLRTIGV